MWHGAECEEYEEGGGSMLRQRFLDKMSCVCCVTHEELCLFSCLYRRLNDSAKNDPYLLRFLERTYVLTINVFLGKEDSWQCVRTLGLLRTW